MHHSPPFAARPRLQLAVPGESAPDLDEAEDLAAGACERGVVGRGSENGCPESPSDA